MLSHAVCQTRWGFQALPYKYKEICVWPMSETEDFTMRKPWEDHSHEKVLSGDYVLFFFFSFSLFTLNKKANPWKRMTWNNVRISAVQTSGWVGGGGWSLLHVFKIYTILFEKSMNSPKQKQKTFNICKFPSILAGVIWRCQESFWNVQIFLRISKFSLKQSTLIPQKYYGRIPFTFYSTT